MKKMKFILTILSMFLFVTASFSQSKAEQKAMDKVEKINAMIVAGDADLALSDDQKKQMVELYVANTKATRKIKKSDATEEEIKEQTKALRKVLNQKVNKEILTKEQRKAKKAGKAKQG